MVGLYMCWLSIWIVTAWQVNIIQFHEWLTSDWIPKYLNYVSVDRPFEASIRALTSYWHLCFFAEYCTCFAVEQSTDKGDVDYNVEYVVGDSEEPIAETEKAIRHRGEGSYGWLLMLLSMPPLVSFLGIVWYRCVTSYSRNLSMSRSRVQLWIISK